MTQKEIWTKRDSLLVILLCLDTAIIAVWLLIYRESYSQIAQVVGGIWAAVVAVLTFLGFKAKETRSLTTILHKPPVRIIIVVYTILIFAAMPAFALWEFPVHTMEVDARLEGVEKVRMSMINNNDQDIAYRNEQGITVWRFKAKQGHYTLSVTPDDSRFETRTMPVDVRPLDITKKISARALFPLGTLTIRPRPDRMTVLLNGRRIAGSSPFTLQVPPGTYRITFFKRGDDDRFGYHARRNATVSANEVATVDPAIAQRRLPELIIVPRDPGGTYTYTLKGENGSESLGTLEGPRRISLFPGQYQLVKKPRNSQETGESRSITIETGRQEVWF